MTVRDFTGEIMVALGEVHDDSILNEGIIAYYTALAVNKLMGQMAGKAIKRGDYKGMTDVVSTFVLPVQLDATTDRRYVAAPQALSLPNARGVNFIAYYRTGLPENCPPQVARVQFDATSWRELPLLYADPISTPSAQRPYFIESPDRINLFGMQPQVQTVELGLVAAFDTSDPTAEIILPPEMIFDLRRMVLMAANWALLSPNERLGNDGREFPVGAQKPQQQAPISVNDPLITATE